MKNNQMTTTLFVPKIMFTNVMSLAPKIVEVTEFILRNDIELEARLKEEAVDNAVDIPGQSTIRRDRCIVEHGGVCLSIKDNYCKYQPLDELKCYD